MKKIIIMIIIANILLFFCISSLYAIEPVGPRLVLDKNVFDAKEVKEGDIIEHTFTISNTGDSLLEINRVKPG